MTRRRYSAGVSLISGKVSTRLGRGCAGIACVLTESSEASCLDGVDCEADAEVCGSGKFSPNNKEETGLEGEESAA